MEQDNTTLLKRLKDGDESALDTLVEQNMGLVRSVARRFLDRGTEYEDLVQIGSVGLMRAARSFDFSYNTMFSTYAVPLIVGEIRRYLRDDGIIKVSRSIKSQGAAIMRAKERFLSEHGREPTLSELSVQCSLTPEEIAGTLEAISPIHSLCEQVGGEDGSTLESLIADRDNVIDSLTDRIALHEAISRLTPRQQEIIRMRYFCDLSQQQTGTLLGLSQVKVSREEKKILEILRKAL